MPENNTTSLGKADLTQKPEDFKKMLFNETPEPSVTNEQPKERAAEDPQKGHPSDNAEPSKTADEKKPEVKETSDTQNPSTEADKPEQKAEPTRPEEESKQLSPDEFRHREAAKAIQEKALERKRAVLALASVVKKSPEEIIDISKQDKKLADEVVKEAFGYNSFDEYQKQVQIEELRETDPEKAELEERLMRIERTQNEDAQRRLEAAENLRKEIFNKFLADKQISNNQFDKRYLQFQESLSLLNPEYLQNNYSAALEKAYVLAFPTNHIDQSKVELQEALNKESKSTTSSTSGVKQSYSQPAQYSDRQSTFAQNLGITLT